MAHSVIPCLRVAAGLAVALGIAVAGTAARAQTRLEANYTISIARIPVGAATVAVDITAGEYAMSMTGRASGVARVLSSGEGTMTARGVIKDGRPLATSYVSTTTSDGDTLAVTMTLEDGSVKEITASAPPPDEDRIPLTDEHRRNVTDPLTALLIPGRDAEDGLGEAACARTLPVFDGRRRYDLKVAFRRMETAKADTGYAGPVVVCTLVLQPIAGHRSASSLLSFLTGGRDMEIAFAPIQGTRLLAPFRITVVNMLGNIVIQASRFETMIPPMRASVPDGDVR